MDFFKKFNVSKPAFQTLSEGEHIVRLVKFKETHSFENYNGEEKEDLPEWENATPQLAMTFVAAKAGESGGITHRFNGCGFTRFEDLTDEQLESGEFTNIEGYACYEDKEGNVVRLESKDNTEACANILNQFANAIGIEEGKSLIDGLNNAIEEKSEIKVTVVNDPYNGKDQYRLTKFAVAEIVKEGEGFIE